MVDTDISYSTGTSRVKIYYGWIVLVACLFLVTMSYGIRFSYGVFFKSLEQDFGWTRALTSGVFSVYMLLGSLFAIIGGWVSDRYGARIVFITMGIFSLLGLGLSSLTNALWHLFISYSILVAVGTGPAYALANALAARWFLKRRGLASAIVTSGVGLGSILLAPVSAYFIENYGWRFAFVIIGVIAFIVMVSSSFFVKRPSSSTAYSPAGGKDGAVDPGSLKVEQIEADTLTFSQAIRVRNFWVILVMWFFYAFCLFTIMTHIVLHATDSGIAPIEAALILSISGFTSIPTRIITGILSDKFGRKPVALACALLMAAALFWLTRSSNLWMLYVFGAAFGAAYGGLAPPILATVADTFGVRHLGMIFGILEVGWVCGAAAGPALAGYIFDVAGKYDLAFIICIVAAILIVASVSFLKMTRKKWA